MKRFGSLQPLVTVPSVAQPELQAGETYWLVAVGEGDAVAAWNVNSLGMFGLHYSDQAGGEVLLPAQAIGAYRVVGVPEPSSVLLFGLGSIALIVPLTRGRIGDRGT